MSLVSRGGKSTHILCLNKSMNTTKVPIQLLYSSKSKICVVEIRRINSCQGTVALIHLHGAGRVNLQLRMQHTPLPNIHWNPVHACWRCLLKLAYHISLYVTYVHEQLWASLVRRQLFSKSLNCTCPFSSLTTLEDYFQLLPAPSRVTLMHIFYCSIFLFQFAVHS